MVCNAAEGRLPPRSARFREQKCCKCQPLYGDVDDMMMLQVLVCYLYAHGVDAHAIKLRAQQVFATLNRD